jgi:hypothetical protein
MKDFFVAHSFALLDEEFDAPDVAADEHLLRALAAGRWGLHPDAWGNYEPMRIAAPPPAPDPGRDMPVDPAWEAEHRRRPVEEPKRKPVKQEPAWQRATWWHKPLIPPREDTVFGFGWLQLDCDDCGAKFEHMLRYPAGLRPAYVVAIRALGREEGWTCIVGRDRCPRCSDVSAVA